MTNPMRKISQGILLLIASCGVLILGYYAYVISSDTVSMPFLGQSDQRGSTLILTIGMPNRLMHQTQSGPLIDMDALAESLELNGVPLGATEFANLNISIQNGDVIQITPTSDMYHDGDIFMIRASRYNSQKKTGYRLPYDISLTIEATSGDMTIEPIGEPRDQMFQVNMSGLEEYASRDIRWYAYTTHESDAICGGDNIAWDSIHYSPVKARLISDVTHGQSETSIYSVEYNTTAPRQCLVAGIGNHIVSVIDRTLADFTIHGVMTDVFSPEYNMKSRFEVDFSTPIFTDSGTLYSASFITERHLQKEKILNAIHITPTVDITPEDIVLTPTRLELVGAFDEGVNYTIKIDNVDDIYGRSATLRTQIIPEKKPYLSLVLSDQKTIFTDPDTIFAKIFALTPPQTTYTMKLCELEFEDYANISEIIKNPQKEDQGAIYSLLGSDRATNCIKKDIALASDSLVTDFAVTSLLDAGAKLSNGWYILAFRNSEDVASFDRFVAPALFSLVDTSITVKASTNGQMYFFIHDITTGLPRPNAQIRIFYNQKNTEAYDPDQNTFSSGVTLGVTDDRGMLALDAEKYRDIIAMMTDSHAPDEYPSWIITATAGESFGYVLSTWDDGVILGGSLVDADMVDAYTAYLHSDQTVYAPGDLVSVHAILRKNIRELTIPTGENFRITITDPEGYELKNAIIKPNDFGTLVTDYRLARDARVGNYMIQIFRESDPSTPIANATSVFSVATPEEPNYTLDITLTSPDIIDSFVTGLRKNHNTDLNTAWYESIYMAPISLEGIVRVHDGVGNTMRNLPFRYRIFGQKFSPKNPDACSTECDRREIASGNATITSDGIGYIRVPIEFASFSDDMIYTLEVIMRDPLTGEKILSNSELIAKLPDQYKSFSDEKSLDISLDHRFILNPGDPITLRVDPPIADNNASLEGKYAYTIFVKKYRDAVLDHLSNHDVFIPEIELTPVGSGTILSSTTILSIEGFEPGEYVVSVAPIVAPGVVAPRETIAEIGFFIAPGSASGIGDVQVFTDGSFYKKGQKARVYFVSPYSSGYLLITRERGSIIDSEYVRMDSNVYVREYTIDGTFEPNVYIGAVAFPDATSSNTKKYALGYGEIVTDTNDTALDITLATDKSVYKNNEKVNLSLVMTRHDGTIATGEFAVMVVDNALIESMGNVDLDIFSRFYAKIPFSVGTAISRVGLDQYRFFQESFFPSKNSTPGIKKTHLTPESNYRNTIYFNGSVLTDASGHANLSFALPDHVTDYRVIVIAQTKDNRFGTAERTIRAHRDYTLDVTMPEFAYPGDTVKYSVNAYNATNLITDATVNVTFGTGNLTMTGAQDLIMNVNTSSSITFDLVIPSEWKGEIPYQVILSGRDGVVLDRISHTLTLRDVPIMADSKRTFGNLTGSVIIPLSGSPNDSHVMIDVSPDILVGLPSIIRGFATRASTDTLEDRITHALFDAYTLRYAEMFRQNNRAFSGTTDDVAKQVANIFHMQKDTGEWIYREGDTHGSISLIPYVLASMIELRDLGIAVPNQSIERMRDTLVSLIESGEGEIAWNPDFLAESFYALERMQDSHSEKIRLQIDPHLLSRHALILYAMGIRELWGHVPEEIITQIDTLMSSWDNTTYSFWSLRADRALYAHLLVRIGEFDRSAGILADLLASTDFNSFFISDEELMEMLRAILTYYDRAPIMSDQHVTISGIGTHADFTFPTTRESLIRTFDFLGEKLGTGVMITSSLPIFYNIFESIPETDIAKIPADQQGPIELIETIESIDESLGLGPDGDWLGVKKLTGNELEFNQLYRVKIEIRLGEFASRSWGRLVFEQPRAAGIRVMNASHLTKSRFFAPAGESWYWTYIMSTANGIWAEIDSGSGDIDATYVYYFRPIFHGTYLGPPPIAYLLYQREIHAIGEYRRFHVE